MAKCYCLQQQRGSIQQDELTAEQRQALLGEDEQQKITSYEEMFRRIKDATGVSDTKVCSRSAASKTPPACPTPRSVVIQ